jgi:hypothetical protein
LIRLETDWLRFPSQALRDLPRLFSDCSLFAGGGPNLRNDIRRSLRGLS